MILTKIVIQDGSKQSAVLSAEQPIGMEMYSINSGQKASKEHIGETGGEFEVRSEIKELGLKKGDKIFIRQFDRVNKYNYKQYFNK